MEINYEKLRAFVDKFEPQGSMALSKFSYKKFKNN
ncbi:MAG: hypothetical protein ACI85H_001320 [Paracoccaceae bacterium]|jgi:hypothetical protein